MLRDVIDMDAVRDRVLADKIALAADVWDQEPLPLGDSILDRHNVVHTPHIAGRTRDAKSKVGRGARRSLPGDYVIRDLDRFGIDRLRLLVWRSRLIGML